MGFDGSECMRVRSGALRDIQFPQCSDKATGTAGTFELKSLVRWLGEMNFTGGRGHSRPAKAIKRAQRSQLLEIPSRFLAECCLPIRSGRTTPRCEQERNRAFRYSESGKHSLEKFAAAHDHRRANARFHPYKKIHASFSPRVSLKFERNLRASLL